MAEYGTTDVLLDFEKVVELEVELEKLGQPTKLLGMELTWSKNNESVKLTQQDSIEKMDKEYSITTIPRRSIPQEGYNAEQEPEANLTKYQSLIGSLLYINRMTRLDISLLVNLLGRQTAKPGTTNYQMAKQFGQFLASTKTEGLLITKKETLEDLIIIYADASYGGENSRSQSGSLVTLYGTLIM